MFVILFKSPQVGAGLPSDVVGTCGACRALLWQKTDCPSSNSLAATQRGSP